MVEGGARLSGDCAEGTVPRGKAVGEGEVVGRGSGWGAEAVGAVNVPVYDFAEFLKTHVVREAPKTLSHVWRVARKKKLFEYTRGKKRSKYARDKKRLKYSQK